MYYKLLFLFVALVCCFRTYSQSVSYTYDSKNDIDQCKQYVTMLDNLQETVKQSDILTKAKDLMETADKALTKINNKLNEIVYVEMIVRREVYIVRTYSTYISNVKSMKYIKADDIQGFESSLSLLISDSEKLLDMAHNILSDDWFKMDDGQRINQLKDIDKGLSETQTSMDIYYDQLSYNNQGAAIKELVKSF